MYGEITRESQVNFAAGDNRAADGKPHWKKCRLVLAKISGTCQHILSFYSPPKVAFFVMIIKFSRGLNALLWISQSITSTPKLLFYFIFYIVFEAKSYPILFLNI